MALGLGMIATYLHAVLRRDPDPLGPYHDAQDLIRQLIELSDGFGPVLDPATLGTGLLDTVRDELPAAALAVYVARDRDLAPLVTWSMRASPEHTDGLDRVADLAMLCFESARSTVEGQVFAFPLSSGGSAVGVVAGRLSERLDAERIGLDDRIRELGLRLAPSVVRLDTALLFETLRDRATARERRRLAREMHDGLAQDIASLGYLVDGLAAEPSGAAQAARIEALRQRITSVVAEVRHSVVTLRTSVGESPSLGAALGSLARRLTESSGVPVHVTLDEQETRLRPEVEAELFRIAQQAMTNAVQHAGASAIDVHCRERPRTGTARLPGPRHHARARGADRRTPRRAPAASPWHERHRPGARPGAGVDRVGRPHGGGDRMTTVLLVDDHELIRSGLAAVIDLEADLKVVGTAATVAAGLVAVADLQPDVVVADLQLPDGTGLHIARAARR